MAGFLDPEQRVIDMVLTETGKQSLKAGKLRFVYWIPFDDEVDYNPPATPRPEQTLAQRQQELTETPLVREATMGYAGTNLKAEDTINVHRPMFTVPPSVGHSGSKFPLPQMAVSTGSLSVSMSQQPLETLYIKTNSAGVTVQQVGPLPAGIQRFGSTEAILAVNFPTASFPREYRTEGFLATVLLSGNLKFLSGNLSASQGEIPTTGSLEEILHNRDSAGDITYRNDIMLKVYTP
jgi:hypothetical protein